MHRIIRWQHHSVECLTGSLGSGGKTPAVYSVQRQVSAFFTSSIRLHWSTAVFFFVCFFDSLSARGRLQQWLFLNLNFAYIWDNPRKPVDSLTRSMTESQYLWYEGKWKSTVYGLEINLLSSYAHIMTAFLSNRNSTMLHCYIFFLLLKKKIESDLLTTISTFFFHSIWLLLLPPRLQWPETPMDKH